MKNMINTIGKKMHTLVKKKHTRAHTTLPNCCMHIYIGREVRLMLPNTYQEIYDTHTCLNFSKTCQNVFYSRNIKKPV